MDRVLDSCSLNYPGVKKAQLAVAGGIILHLVAAIQTLRIVWIFTLGRVKLKVLKTANET